MLCREKEGNNRNIGIETHAGESHGPDKAGREGERERGGGTADGKSREKIRRKCNTLIKAGHDFRNWPCNNARRVA